MDQSDHLAGQGVNGSGYVMSVVRSAEDIKQMDVLVDGHFLALTLPGRPCEVVLCLTGQGALVLVERIAEGVQQAAGHDRSGTEHD